MICYIIEFRFLTFRLTLNDDARKRNVRKTNEEKQLLENRKMYIQSEFKKRLSLSLDMPKQGTL